MLGEEIGAGSQGRVAEIDQTLRDKKRKEFRGEFAPQPRRPACEWSRGAASDMDGQAERPNGAFGKSDIEGKAVMVVASELGSERVSNEREPMSQSSSPRASLQCTQASRRRLRPLS
jgi:hypothetical protein